jgi:hypothetical protein
MAEPKYFEIKYPLERPGVKKRWIRIGSATEYEGEFGAGIACTIDAVPINWDGTFHIFPVKK